MSTFPAAQRYTAKARYFHWLMAALIVIAYTLILSRSQFPRGSDPRALVVQTHYWVGILLFVLAFPRLIHRQSHRPPDITPRLEGFLKKAAFATHVLLYAFLFVQPILGFSSVLIGKGAVPFPLTHFEIPSPFDANKDLGHTIEGVHKLIGTIFYYVIGLHVVAALFHHCVRKDNALRRML